MVWGAYSIHGASRLFIVQGTMDAKEYIEVLSSPLKPQIHEWFGGNPCIFQLDSAPCHTAKKVQEWMKKNHLKVLPWPGNSRNMNPIESLWDVLKDEIHEFSATKKTQVIERLIRTWFHSEKIKALYGMPRRVATLK